MNIASFIRYWLRMVLCALTGSRPYLLWMALLLACLAFGFYFYVHHLTDGLVVTHMTDQVSWGIGIASFDYFVGVAAGAAVVVFPAYLMKRKDMEEVAVISQLMAVTAVSLCLLFIATDMGRPERMWHLFPFGGELNLPSSLLAWDVVVFSGYLLLNMHIPGYLLYRQYRGLTPQARYYVPLVFVSLLWAIGIHTVTAFLLSGLGARHHWASALLAPRFLISSGATAPALMVVIFAFVRHYTPLKVKDSVFDYLKTVLRITMPINLFLLGCEVFQEFYSGNMHSVSAQYLYFGVHGHDALTPFIWTAIVFNVIATAVFLVDRLGNNKTIMYIACGLTIVGIWVEKGMGVIFPGFIPSPAGEFVEYVPNLGELAVHMGVLALGALMFSAMTKVAIAIQTGRLRRDKFSIPPGAPSPNVAAPHLGREAPT